MNSSTAGALVTEQVVAKPNNGPSTRAGLVANFGAMLEAYNNKAGRDLVEGDNPVPINANGGLSEWLIDLSDARMAPGGAGIQVEGFCFGVIYAVSGSQQGAGLQFNFDQGGALTTVLPGCRIDAPFQKMTVTRAANAPATGFAKLILRKRADCDWDESALPATGSELLRVATTPAANSTANVPSLATDGVDITFARGVRCILSADSGQTLTGGSVRVWLFEPGLGRWVLGNTSESVGTGLRDFGTSDYEVAVGYGRIFFEALSVTVSAGALNQVTQAWGA